VYLEEIAYQYASMSEEGSRAAGYGVAVVGGLLGGITARSSAELQRAPYFAYTALYVLALGLFNYASVPALVPAMKAGYFWVLMGSTILIQFAGGFVIARLAMCRSRDAFGHAKLAPLAFIPLANFWLYLAPSRMELSGNRMPVVSVFSGAVGVVVGLVIFASGITLLTQSMLNAERAVEDAMADGNLFGNNLEQAVTALANGLELPVEIDEVTTLVRMEPEGTILRYVYEVSVDLEFLPVIVRTTTTQMNCTNEDIAVYIRDGVTLQHLYVQRDGREIGTVEVTKEVCGF